MFTILYYPELDEVVSYREGSWAPILLSSIEEAKQEIENNTFYINISSFTGEEILPPFEENKKNPPLSHGLKIIPKYLLEVVEV